MSLSSILLPLILGGTGIVSKLLEKPAEEKRFQQFTPEQQRLQSQLLSLLGGAGGEEGLLGELLGEKGLEKFAAPARKEFFEQVVPGIAERFTGLGAQRSSGFQQALARSGEDLATRLSGLRGQQQLGALSSLLGTAFKPSFVTAYQPAEKGPLAEFLSPITQLYGQHLGSKLGGML